MEIPKLSVSMFIGVSGKDIISFGSGQPYFLRREGVFKPLSYRKDFRYGLIQGNLNLREAFQNNIQVQRLTILWLPMELLRLLI